MSLKIYSTLSRKKEDFETLQPGQVRMYVCGPTVYSKAHVGHAMSALVFDIIRRYLEYRGYQVMHAMNFTDVDDKIINRASQAGMDPFELAEKYILEFEQNLEDLNVKPATIKPRATREITQIIEMVKGLVEHGYAYPLDGDVYFRVRMDGDYGKLSGRKLDDNVAGSRIEVDERKEDPLDFALWKSARPGEPYWDSPWGKGRPGWHIECSAMNLHHLGEQIDIHGGGNDLIFPHHENEIAQTELVITGIGDHPHDPGAERTAAVAVQVAVSRDKRALRRVFRCVIIRKNAVSQVERQVLQGQHQLVKRVEVARFCRQDQCLLIHIHCSAGTTTPSPAATRS